MLDPFFFVFIFIDTTGVCHFFDRPLGPTGPRRRLDWNIFFVCSCIHVYVVYIWSVFILWPPYPPLTLTQPLSPLLV